ncbi:PadR family transcriptional regulator [Roseisolibacter sp. H3M3-2]|uniref:PadR family transcriptional regulator n=1 Tax=Roseisolibacter sp. H3M3-2 TaxID=3031323 RepID=UPI0023DB9ECF|nr:PadR family transcriptional regulator [Roseisolibacter sp. H3M3-2]MDF1505463.1 PadR family transcriptional regulator [Roseisolibacter sp. H3M3-2]
MLPRLALVKGTLDVLVLRALARRAMHGFEVATWLEERSDGALDLDDSALYQALYRLEQRGLIAAEWGVTPNNRRARYYGLTDAGAAHLREETATWLRYAATVTGILTDPQPAV